MSLRNRARSLQKKTGLTYQQALERVRALGERPARLRRETGWPLDVCDRFLVDGHAPIAVMEADRSHAPIEVIAPACGPEVQRVCETLRMTASARAVLLVDAHDRVIAHVESEPIPSWLDALETARDSSRSWWQLDGGRRLVKAVVKTRKSSRYSRIAAVRALLFVGFEARESSLGLVRLRMANAVAALDRLLSEDEPPPLPPIAGGGRGGVPAELRVVEPVPEERPKKKPTPIGRKRKREH